MVRVAKTNGIPSAVLAGRIPRFKTVNTVFLASIVRKWYQLAYNSYVLRSDLGKPPNMKNGGDPPVRGLPDREKNTWKQLKPSTYRVKKSLQKTGKYTEYLQRINTPAAEHVLEAIQTMNYRKGEGTNIRTGRLLASFFPPRVVGGKLLAGPDQLIKINGLNIDIDFKISYAKRITEGLGLDRPVFVNGNDLEWLQKAIQIGLIEARKEYDRLSARYGPYGQEKRNDNRSRSRRN